MTMYQNTNGHKEGPTIQQQLDHLLSLKTDPALLAAIEQAIERATIEAKKLQYLDYDIEWIVPLGAGPEHVTLRASARDIVAVQRRRETRYTSDTDALTDFMVVHWGSYVPQKKSTVTADMLWSAYNMCPDYVQGQPARMRWMADYINRECKC